MTVRTDDLTTRDLGLNARKGIALMDQLGNPRGLLSYVVELQDQWICKRTVGATCAGKQAKNVAPCLGSPAFARRTSLVTVERSALADVLGSTPLAPGLALVELGRRQVSSATSAVPSLDRLGGWSGRRWRIWWRPIDPARPKAHRGKRHAQLEGDRAKRLSLRAKSSGFALLAELPDRHTNICSQTDRTH
jgi:hypothetical protein